MKIPFSTSTEFKNAMSGVDLNLDMENIRSSLNRVPNDLIEIIGLSVYNEMIVHYETAKTSRHRNLGRFGGAVPKSHVSAGIVQTFYLVANPRFK